MGRASRRSKFIHDERERKQRELALLLDMPAEMRDELNRRSRAKQIGDHLRAGGLPPDPAKLK